MTYKITPQEFIDEMVNQYNSSKNIVWIKGVSRTDNISRGRSHSVSSVFEDIFAIFLYENLKEKYNDLTIFVDQPISYFYEGKTYTCYPDILLCRLIDENVYSILYMFDLKTNAGWFRDKIKEAGIRHSDFVDELKNADKVRSKNGQQKDRLYKFYVSNQLKYDIAFLSSDNINKKIFYNSISEINKSNNTHAWVLSDSCLNDYNSNNSHQPKENEFDDMFEILLNTMNYFSEMKFNISQNIPQTSSPIAVEIGMKDVFVEPDNIEDFMIIKVRDEIVEERHSRYEATRICWKISLEEAKKHNYVLSVTDGIVRAIYKVTEWFDVTSDYLTCDRDIGRVMFKGDEVTDKSICDRFLNKMIPEKYRKKGMASPCLYCKK